MARARREPNGAGRGEPKERARETTEAEHH